jgi:hypothetical protein
LVAEKGWVEAVKRGKSEGFLGMRVSFEGVILVGSADWHFEDARQL